MAMLLLFSVNWLFSRWTQATLLDAIGLGYENQDLVRLLQEQTTELAEQSQAAQQANAAKTKFLAAASHDLRQPVHALHLFIEVLSASDLNAHQRSILGHIQAASGASRNMLNTLLDYSRIEAGVLQAKMMPVALAPLLLSLQEEFGLQADAKNLVYRSRDTQAVAVCDGSLLALILRNLIGNAIRYTHQGGVLIAVRLRRAAPDGLRLGIQVWDTGIGIAADQQEEIFREFYQLDNEERDRQKGLGLGLAIAKGLAQTMNARIQLQSVPGRGSVFTLWLAAYEPGSMSSQASALSAGEPRNDMPRQTVDLAFRGAQDYFSIENQNIRADARLQGLRILIVDDEAAVRASMQALLEIWGCQVQAADGIEQMRALLQLCPHEQRPQVLITDYRLRAGETGGDVIAQLEKSGFAPPTRIIITGDTAPERIREAAGQDAILLHKPVNVYELQKLLLRSVGVEPKW